MYVSVFVCVCLCVGVCLWVCLRMHLFVCMCVCVCVCTCMSLYEHVCTAEDTLGQAIWFIFQIICSVYVGCMLVTMPSHLLSPLHGLCILCTSSM